MTNLIITKPLVRRYAAKLVEEEKSPYTREKYLRDLRRFAAYAGSRPVTKAMTLGYKAELERRYPARSVNSLLAALNSFLRFAGRDDLRVRHLRTQKDAFRPESAELTRDEYIRLIDAADALNDELASLILQTICSTGIRVSELKYVTVEAVKLGETDVACMGKTRRIFIVSALRDKLLRFAKKNGTKSGPVFCTKGGKPLDRSNVWRKMKSLCGKAGIPEQKVFPHNLRHLFARTFYENEHDLAALADILGHSSINTTRIYIISTGAEHAKRMENMDLVL